MNLTNLSRRGFESAEELLDLVAQINLVEHAEALKIWDDAAGPKADLVAMLPSRPMAKLVQSEFDAALMQIPTFHEFYERCEELEDASKLVASLYLWREAKVARLTATKFNELSAQIDEHMAAGMSEIDAFGSVVLSAIGRIVAGKQVDEEIETFMKLKAAEAQAQGKEGR